MGLAGIIEFVGGLFILVGLFTRLTALITSLEMLVAYFMSHVGGGWFPNTNGGELAVLYFVAFLVMMVHGNGKWNLEKLILKKEVF